MVGRNPALGVPPPVGIDGQGDAQDPDRLVDAAHSPLDRRLKSNGTETCNRRPIGVPSQTVTLLIPDGATLRRGAFATVGIVLIAYLVWVVREIWLPLGLALVLATVLDPVVDRMEARGWKRITASAFIFGSSIFFAGALLYLATPYVVAQGVEAQRSFTKFFPDTSQQGLAKSLARLNLPESVTAIGAQAFESGRKNLGQSASYLTHYGMDFLSNLVWVVIVPIVAFYALVDFHVILGKSLLLVPRRNRNMAQTYMQEVSGVFSKYLRGLAILSLLNGAATCLVLSLLHVPSALVVGIAAGILYSVPYIGAFITVAITAAAAFVGGGVHMMALAVGVSIVLHQIIFDQMISPRLLGGTVGLHPILSIIALLSGNLLLGIIGMILAVPIAACIQILILALVPKLRVEVESSGNVPAHNEAGERAQESRDVLASTGKTGGHSNTVESAIAVAQARSDAVADADR